MKFLISWLKEHLQTDCPLDQITDTLTMTGLEVEKVTDRAKQLAGFVVARVVSAEPHPGADKLRVCIVDSGAETHQVVCGAPNARAGMKGVFAAVGSYVPGTDMTLKRAHIRGVESNGMLLSEREMGLSDDHDGIVDLPADATVGARAIDVMGLADPVIEIAVTPNRGDCLGVRGIARDLAAAGLGTLKPLTAAAVPGTFASPVKVHLDLPDGKKSACPYFVGRLIRGVHNGESPRWLKDRLLSIGLRPIAALVDITNLLTFDLGRPLHVFDADLVSGDIRARLAKPGERMIGLNGKEYLLDDDMTVIADDQGAEALGGVMGGERTGCTEKTVNVFIESALFDPVRTAATGRKLNIQSDARYRFERGIDASFLEHGMEIATRLVLDLCGGEPSELVVAGGAPERQPAITLRLARIRELAGIEVPRGEVERILAVLGFLVEGPPEALRVTVPPWRNDIVGEACLVEEVIRIHGLDKVPAVPMMRDSALPKPALSPGQRRRAGLRRALAARGLVEAVTVSFMASSQADLFGGVPDGLRLVNPISSDLDVMRPSVLPNLIAAAGRNRDRGIADARLFELGPQFHGGQPGEQRLVAAGIRAGQAAPRHWSAPPRAVDAFDAKADALAAIAAAGGPVAKVQVMDGAPEWYHPGRSGTLRLGPKTVLAAFGEVHPGVLAEMGVKGPVAAFELFVDALPKQKTRASAAKPHLALSSLQPVERDFAFVVDAGLAAETALRAARGADNKLIADVYLFDSFSGEGLGAGKKSLAMGVVLQPIDQTLTDADIEAVSARIIAAVEKATGGSLRS